MAVEGWVSASRASSRPPATGSSRSHGAKASNSPARCAKENRAGKVRSSSKHSTSKISLPLHALVKELRKEFGSIHGLVNNAGLGTSGILATMHDSQIERLVRLNTLSPIMLTKYVVRAMMADGGGRIVNVASIVAFTGYSGISVYSATKASIIGFTKSLAREVGPLGINVNAIAPGFLDTEMTESLTGQQREQIARRSALHHLAEVDDVANAVEYLLSDKAKNITGTVLTVDAGNTA